jgi:hypothetical protein
MTNNNAKPVNIYDTAATVARMLELMTPEAWIAKPVVEAFEKIVSQ